MKHRLFACLICLLLVGGCTTKHYRASADKEVGRIIKHKTRLVPNMDPDFTIEFTNEFLFKSLPVSDKAEEALGEEANSQRGARILSLEEALKIAVVYGRDYQTRKETVFVSALNLTLDRHRYRPLFSGKTFGVDETAIAETKQGVNKLVETTHDLDADGTATGEVLLRTGGKLLTDFTMDFMFFFTGRQPVVTTLDVAGTLTQPLLRGAGYRVAMEKLTQSERNTLYALRDFTRFRKEYVVQVASDYYEVLQNLDTMRNNYRGYQNFQQNVAREKAYYDEGRRSRASLDQLKQAELETQSKWINSVRTYRKSLDDFKFSIGLRNEVPVVLDEKQFERLAIVQPKLNVAEAVQVAMVSRLDLATKRDQVDDAGRHIKVAANALLPQVDLTANASINRAYENSPGVAGKTTTTYNWDAGVHTDIPFDRKAERNAYRTELINLERAKRDFETLEESVKTQILDDLRNLDDAKRNYEIKDVAVKIAERRVEEQQLRQELGRGTSRDLVDAELDSIDAKNTRTSALVTHTIARLRLFRDMGVLWVKNDGQWEENHRAAASPRRKEGEKSAAASQMLQSNLVGKNENKTR